MLANEIGTRRISVNAVAPDPVATPLFMKWKYGEMIAGISKQVPFNRIGEVSDIVPIVAFLASPASSWVNGQVVRVNGGFI